MAPSSSAHVAQQLPPRIAVDCPLKGRFVVPAEEASLAGRTLEQVQAHLFTLVEPASALARPPISNFSVGAVGLGHSGAIYVGVNLEFPGLHLNQSVHAEQCLLLNCLLHGERGIKVLAVSEAPCGHCRQFFCEVDSVDDTVFVFGAGSHWAEHHPSASAASLDGATGNGAQQPHHHHHAAAKPRPTAAYRLDQLLPARFGPSDLMSEDETFPLLLAPQGNRVALAPGALAHAQEELAAVAAGAPGGGTVAAAAEAAVRSAEHWARQSYSPYTKSPSGAAIITKEGKVYAGPYVESAAFNPSLTPFHAAWVAAVVDHISGFDQIAHVVLAQLPDAKVQHARGVEALLQTVSPGARLTNVALVATGP